MYGPSGNSKEAAIKLWDKLPRTPTHVWATGSDHLLGCGVYLSEKVANDVICEAIGRDGYTYQDAHRVPVFHKLADPLKAALDEKAESDRWIEENRIRVRNEQIDRLQKQLTELREERSDEEQR